MVVSRQSLFICGPARMLESQVKVQAGMRLGVGVLGERETLAEETEVNEEKERDVSVLMVKVPEQRVIQLLSIPIVYSITLAYRVQTVPTEPECGISGRWTTIVSPGFSTPNPQMLKQGSPEAAAYWPEEQVQRSQVTEIQEPPLRARQGYFQQRKLDDWPRLDCQAPEDGNYSLIMWILLLPSRTGAVKVSCRCVGSFIYAQKLMAVRAVSGSESAMNQVKRTSVGSEEGVLRLEQKRAWMRQRWMMGERVSPSQLGVENPVDVITTGIQLIWKFVFQGVKIVILVLERSEVSQLQFFAGMVPKNRHCTTPFRLGFRAGIWGQISICNFPHVSTFVIGSIVFRPSRIYIGPVCPAASLTAFRMAFTLTVLICAMLLLSTRVVEKSQTELPEGLLVASWREQEPGWKGVVRKALRVRGVFLGQGPKFLIFKVVLEIEPEEQVKYCSVRGLIESGLLTVVWFRPQPPEIVISMQSAFDRANPNCMDSTAFWQSPRKLVLNEKEVLRAWVGKLTEEERLTRSIYCSEDGLMR